MFLTMAIINIDIESSQSTKQKSKREEKKNHYKSQYIHLRNNILFSRNKSESLSIELHSLSSLSIPLSHN